MKILKWFFILIVILAAAAFLWGKFYRNGEASKQAFKLATVTEGSIQAIVTSTGQLNPLNTVKVGSQVSGNIKELYVDFNSPVKKDQVIALIDPAIYGAQVAQAKAQLLMARMQFEERQEDIQAAEAGVKRAEAQLNSSRATFRDAKLRYNRLAMLKDTVAKSDVDSAQAIRDSAKGAVDMANAGILTAKAQLMRAAAQKKGVEALIAERQAALNLTEIKLQYCTIQSPINGVVISRDVDVGQTVAATLQSPVLFTIAEDLARMQVEVDVSEADVGQIKAGQDILFTVDAFPEKKFRAKVREVRNVATNIQNVVTYKVVADVENDALLLRPDMTANVSIVVAKVDHVLKVPNGALRFKPPGEAEERKPEKKPSIRERPLYKNAVSKVGLDTVQSEALIKIIEQAGLKLKAVYALPEADRDVKLSWKTFYTQVFTNLYKILREDQYQRYRDYISELREARKKRDRYKGRSAKLYIPDESGEPKRLNITAGITDDDETQIIQGDLKVGDKVIVGLLFNAGERPKQGNNPFSMFFKRS
ncbi:MAG: efflux RND transporter periplasmic adaptor subunit [Desulfobacteraceae bacterium]|nr:efflux RND transporter periplasmic adaptor subunit [Desulfobacteraceae bacterium]